MSNKSTGAIMSIGNQKKFRDMSLDEQIVFYQNKASLLKRKQAEQRDDHHRTIGRLFVQVIGDVKGSDEEIVTKFNQVKQILFAYQNSNRPLSDPTGQTVMSSVQSVSASQGGTLPEQAAIQSPAGPNKD